MRRLLAALLALVVSTSAMADDLPLPERSAVRTRALTLSVGGAAGIGGVPAGFFVEETGREPSLSWSWSGSPAIAFGWEVGTPRVRFFADTTAYPTYVYWVGSDVVSLDLVHLTAGALFGSDAVRVGPEAFAGLVAAGGGVRAVVTPWVGPHGRRHGLDLRADMLAAGGPTFRLAAMYTFTPWKRVGGAGS